MSASDIAIAGRLTFLYENNTAEYDIEMAKIRRANFNTNLQNGGYTRNDDGTYTINDKYVEHPMIAHHEALVAARNARLALENAQ